MGLHTLTQTHIQWLSDTEKEARALERVSERSLLRDTAERPTSRFWKASQSQLSEDWPEEEELRESASSSTTTPETSSRASWAESSEMPSPTPSMPRGRLLPLWMLSMLSRDRAEPSMVSVRNQAVG